MKKYIYLFLSIIAGSHLGAHDLVLMPGYKNSLANVDVYEGDRGPVLELTFTDDGPICNYVPRSAHESNNTQMRRYYVPLSDINESEVNEMIQYVHHICKRLDLDVTLSICDAPCVGLECLFKGNLDIKKRINAANKTISFEITKRDGRA